MKNLKRRGLLLLLILTLLNALYSAALAQSVKYEEGKIYEHTLKNGLAIFTVERHIAPLIYSQLTYKVGARNEHLGITGISHIVEHMMFKGTGRYTKGKVSKLIADNGGLFNAFTSNDLTSYYEYLPANKIDMAFDIESDRMMNSIFDPNEFKSEIDVILQERRMRTESSVNGLIRETMYSTAYTSHPYRDPVIGWPVDIRNITRDQAYDYYKSYYTPNNAFLVLVGDFKTDDIIAKADKYFGIIPKGKDVPEVHAFQEEQYVRKEFTIYHNDVTDPSVRFAFHVPSYAQADAAALRAASSIFAERSRDARLYKRFVEDDQIALSAGGGFGMTKDPTLFQVAITARPESGLDKIESVFWEELGKMQSEQVSDRELQKIKNRYKFNQIVDYIKNTAIGSRLTYYEALYGWNYYDAFNDSLSAVTKEDIQRVMKKYFAPEKATVAYVYPKEGHSEEPSSDMETEEDISDDTENPHVNSSEDGNAYFQPPAEAIKILDNAIDGNYDDIIEPNPIAPLIKTAVLNNGIKLYMIEDHLAPTVSVVGIIETGYIMETLDGQIPGISNFLGDVMNRGSQTMSYDQLTERMSFVPFSFSVSGSHRGFYFQGNSLVENADEMFHTGYDIVTRPLFDSVQIEKIRPRYIISAKNRLKRTSMQAFYHMFNTIFDGHPITKFNSTVESMTNLKRSDLETVYKKYFNPHRTTMLMVADMSTEQMTDLANKYFGSWQAPAPSFEIFDKAAPKELKKKEISVFKDMDYKECTINIGFAPSSNVEDDDEDIFYILNYVLASSALTSRMGVELRDKQGLIYGIKSELWTTGDGVGYWKLNVKTAPENTKKVLKGIFNEARKFLKDGITDEELAASKERRLRLFPFQVETPDDIAQILFDMIKNKEPLDTFDKKASVIKNITKEDIQRVAAKYFTMDKYVIVVDGPIEEDALQGFENEL